MLVLSVAVFCLFLRSIEIFLLATPILEFNGTLSVRCSDRVAFQKRNNLIGFLIEIRIVGISSVIPPNGEPSLWQ